MLTLGVKLEDEVHLNKNGFLRNFPQKCKLFFSFTVSLMPSLLMSGGVEYSVMLICIVIIDCFTNAVSCVLKTKVPARRLLKHFRIIKKKNW